jgi:hypothetical protein
MAEKRQVAAQVRFFKHVLTKRLNRAYPEKLFEKRLRKRNGSVCGNARQISRGGTETPGTVVKHSVEASA